MDNKLCNSCGAFIDGLCITINGKDAEIAELKERLQKAEAQIEQIIGICDGTIGPMDYEHGPYETIQHHAEKALNAIRGKEESK